MKKIAAAYVRVSTEEQAEYSPDSQLKKICEYAEKNGFALPEENIYSDEGISGKSTKKREGFKRMIADAKQLPRRFDVILVWKFSRFARSREDSIVYKAMLKRELGIRVISVSEDVGDDKMSVIFEAMIEAMDEYYSLNLAEEVKRGMIEKVNRGEPCAVAPFGYKMINKKYVLIPEEEKIIRLVFEKFISGESMTGIARELTELGIRTHRGGKIENRTVEYWLNNPIYVGRLRWNPDGKTRRYHWNDDGVMIADGEHCAIVSESIWKRAQQMQKSAKKSVGYEKKGPKSWLVGIVKCGICGGAMVNCSGYFYCNNKIKGTCRGNGGVRAEALERGVVGWFERLEESWGSIAVFEKSAERSAEKGVYRVQLERAEQRLKRIKAAFENGVDSLDEYNDAKKRICSEIELIKAQIPKTQEMSVEEKSIAEILASKADNATKSRVLKRTVLKIVKTDKEKYSIFLD